MYDLSLNYCRIIIVLFRKNFHLQALTYHAERLRSKFMKFWNFKYCTKQAELLDKIPQLVF